MAGIISVGLGPLPITDAGVRVPAVGAPVGRADLERLVDEVRAAVAEHGVALVVYPSWLPAPTVVRLQTVRSALDTASVAFYASPSPPLAGAVLVSLAAGLRQRLPSAGALLAALALVERWLVAFTWLARPPALPSGEAAYPVPSLGDRLAAFWPSTAFAACSWPQPSVHLLTRHRERVPLPSLPPGVGLVVAGRDTETDWMHAAVAGPLGSLPVLQVEPTPLGPAYWGQRRLVEAVAYPLSMDSAARALTELQAGTCRWCGHLSTTATCAFCRAPDDRPLSMAGARP